MQRPLTSVELLHVQQSYRAETSVNALKRSYQSFESEQRPPLQQAYNTYPQGEPQHRRYSAPNGIENRDIQYKRSRPASPPPKKLEVAVRKPSPVRPRQPVTECSLCHPRWGIPNSVLDVYQSSGIASLYDWQNQCLSLDGVLSDHRNLIYTAPTSAGKTMVAELLVIRESTVKKKKCIIVLPFVSIVTEKTKHFRKLLAKESTEVASFHGGARHVDVWDIAICTIEKANSLINNMLDENTIDQLGVLVLDEMHMIGDPQRGYIMELLITKVLAIQLPIQIIGMSATMKNVEILARWINGHFYDCDFRPIPLCEFLVSENVVMSPEKQPIRQLSVIPHPRMTDSLLNSIITLTLETLQDGHSVLVFCASRFMTVETAKQISKFVATTSPEHHEARLSLIQRLRNSPSGLDEMLEGPILKGVAYHHAGLTTEERELLEEAYDTGILKVLTATATLAAGINLPSRRVIFRGPRMGRDFLSVASYRQMKGRAGRKGKDTHGESYMCYSKHDEEEVMKMVNGEMPAIESYLGLENKGFERALLEAVSANLATSQIAIETYAKWTLYYHQLEDSSGVTEILRKAEEYLIENGLAANIEHGFTQAGGGLQSTTLGKAIVSAALSIDEGLFVHRELERSMRKFILDDELHLIYHCTPVYAQCEIDWKIFRSIFDGLSDTSVLVASALGVSPTLINRMAQGGTLKEDTPSDQEKLRIHRRFWISLMVQQLIKEEPLSKVAETFGIERGFLQNLSSTTSGFASMMQTFCSKLGWGNLALLLGGFKDRLAFGVRPDLLQLTKLPYVKGFTARIFWEGGMKSVSSIAESDIDDILPLLVKSRFNSRRRKLDDVDAELQDQIDRRTARIIIKAARRLRDQDRVVDFEE